MKKDDKKEIKYLNVCMDQAHPLTNIFSLFSYFKKIMQATINVRINYLLI